MLYSFLFVGYLPLKVDEAAYIFEKSVTLYQYACQHIRENLAPHQHPCPQL
jgi:hypothetical protein